jgi:hypothetical protein
MLQVDAILTSKLRITINKDKNVKSLPVKSIAKVAEAGVFFSTFLPLAAHAVPEACPNAQDVTNSTIDQGAQCAKGNSNADALFGPTGIFSKIANVLIFLVGAIAVIMLIWGGLQYVISAGDSKRVESAKNTILYAIIGIVIAILAFAIVSFVTGQFATSTTAPTP